MSLDTTAAPVAVDDDQARYAEMAKELGSPAPTPAPAVEPPAPAKAEERKPDPLAYEELDKRYRNLQGALGEARGETRTIKQTMDQLTSDNARMQQFLQRIAQQQAPAQDEDPYLGPVQRQVQALADQQRQILEYQKQQQKVSEQQQETYEQQQRQQSEAQFARENPDYYEAVEHLKQGRLQEYAVMYPDGHAATETMAINNGFRTAAEMRVAMLMQDVQHIGSLAMQQGMRPAEMAYNLSKQRGYTPRQAAPIAAPAAPAARPQASRIDTIRQGQQAASSLSTGPTGSPTESAWPSHSELARMYLEDPEKAEGFIAKMQRSGALN